MLFFYSLKCADTIRTPHKWLQPQMKQFKMHDLVNFSFFLRFFGASALFGFALSLSLFLCLCLSVCRFGRKCVFGKILERAMTQPNEPASHIRLKLHFISLLRWIEGLSLMPNTIHSLTPFTNQNVKYAFESLMKLGLFFQWLSMHVIGDYDRLCSAAVSSS